MMLGLFMILQNFVEGDAAIRVACFILIDEFIMCESFWWFMGDVSAFEFL